MPSALEQIAELKLLHLPKALEKGVSMAADPILIYWYNILLACRLTPLLWTWTWVSLGIPCCCSFSTCRTSISTYSFRYSLDFGLFYVY